MTFEIEEVGSDKLSQYAEIPISFKVESIFKVEPVNQGLGGILLREEKVEHPYLKDYDAYEDGDARLERWTRCFDIRNWGIFLARQEQHCVGGAVVAYNTAGVHMLAGRKDLALLWDIRIHPGFRRQGIGTKLFKHALNWSRKRGCRQLKIETQNINVPACKFYARQGCQLGEINFYGYAGHPKVRHEIMLIWYLNL